MGVPPMSTKDQNMGETPMLLGFYTDKWRARGELEKLRTSAVNLKDHALFSRRPR